MNKPVRLQSWLRILNPPGLVWKTFNPNRLSGNAQGSNSKLKMELSFSKKSNGVPYSDDLRSPVTNFEKEVFTLDISNPSNPIAFGTPEILLFPFMDFTLCFSISKTVGTFLCWLWLYLQFIHWRITHLLTQSPNTHPLDVHIPVRIQAVRLVRIHYSLISLGTKAL